MQRTRFAPRTLRYLCTSRRCRRDKLAFLTVHSRDYGNEYREQATAKINELTNSFFNYTSGRWLYNEHLRLSERKLYFNINELCHLVAKSVGLTATDISVITKLAEGGSYRIFEVTFRNGLKAIARLPYPCTIPRKHGIASEVATMEYLRMHGIPVAKIFDWSSSASNPLGCEYMIMERVQGKELAETWYTMTFQQRKAVVEKIVNIEKRIFDIRFPACGSIFFKDFLDHDIKSVDLKSEDDNNFENIGKFCIGPSNEYLWWYQRRNELAVNPGPWKSSEEVLKAVGEREISWLQKFGKKRYPREPLDREFYHNRKVDPLVQINHLSNYLRVAPYLVPKDEQLNMPTIRHPDLSPSNIFISDSGDITGIIDWQHTAIFPLFLQAKIPKHFQNYGDDDSESFRRPELPEDFANKSSNQQEVELDRLRRRQVRDFYLGYTSDLNKPHFHAMGKHNLVLRNKLYDVAGRPWEGDNTSLQAQLIKTMERWSEITSDPEENPPICYSPVEVEECLDRHTKQNNADEQMQYIRDFIRINIDGLVLNDEFEGARERARLMKDELAEGADTEDERREFEKI